MKAHEVHTDHKHPGRRTETAGSGLTPLTRGLITGKPRVPVVTVCDVNLKHTNYLLILSLKMAFGSNISSYNTFRLSGKLFTLLKVHI